MQKYLWAMVATASIAVSAHAQVFVSPTSYDMLNGNTGSFHYWDEAYNGSGNNQVDNASLTGGLGSLTDGVITTQRWDIVEAGAGPHPYVGWTIDPTITFHFAQAYRFSSMTVYFDDAQGFGGVSIAQSVAVNGTTYGVTSLQSTAPNTGVPITFDLSAQNLNTNQLAVTFTRRDAWVFASEVKFQAQQNTSVAPEASTLALVAAVALPLLGGIAVRRRRSL